MKVDPELIMQHGTIGNNYAVEYTANLTTGAWHSITNLALESSSNTWVDVNASGSKGRFYRARPAKLQHFNPPPMTQNEFPVLTIDDVLRDYKLLPVQNDWHVGSIILGSSTALAWSNAAGRVWNLIPDFENQQLVTDETCPYPGQNFQLNFVGGHYTGFHFSGSLYSKVDDVLGDYEKLPVENNWHIGSIISGTSTELAWSNAAGVVWNLIPDYPNQMLLTDETCPYPGHDFQLQYSAGQLAGFYFQGALYSKTGVQVPVFESSSMHGYMGAYYTAAIPEGYNYGFSFYSSICSLLDEPLSGFQIGLPGTWLIPDNRDFFEPLLPPDNRMRMISPSRASNYWRGVFQTIEGGGGAWVTTRFPSSVPKYRMNGSINGYINEVSSPGWGFGQTTALPTNAMGIAQLSNRLLVPPDGLTFDQQPGGEFMGYAWMALPLIPASSGVGAGPVLSMRQISRGRWRFMFRRYGRVTRRSIRPFLDGGWIYDRAWSGHLPWNLVPFQ